MAENKCKICGKDSGKYPLCKKCYAEQRAKVGGNLPNVSDKIKPGMAVRSRDEFFLDGVPKPDKKDDDFYRIGYVIETNNLDEIALVKSTSGKGHYLPSGNGKFKPTAYVQDDTGAFIKISPTDAEKKKFIRSSHNDISEEDVAHIRKRVNKHSDTWVKIKKLKNRRK